jgi:TonB family protein
VAVANFAGPEEGFTQLGKIVSLEFAASLAWSGSRLDVIHSPALAGALREVGPAPKNLDIFDDRVVKRFGQLAGADVIVTGILGLAGDHVELSVRAANAATGTTIAQATGNLPLTPVVKELLAIRLLPFATPPPTVAAPPRQPDFHDGAYDAGRNGVTYPKCIACPTPSYTDKARAAKIRGMVILRLVVLEDGSASRISILRGLGYGLDEECVRTLAKWRFQPATDAAGKPVPAWVTVEHTFNLM